MGEKIIEEALASIWILKFKGGNYE
jgi:hypothetical protein